MQSSFNGLLLPESHHASVALADCWRRLVRRLAPHLYRQEEPAGGRTRTEASNLGTGFLSAARSLPWAAAENASRAATATCAPPRLACRWSAQQNAVPTDLTCPH